MHRILAASLMLMSALLLTTINISAAAINYQGQLNDSSGDPVPDGSHAMTFSLWTDSTGGENLWEEPRTVSTEGGHFSVYLGQVNPISANVIGSANYLQIQVGAETLLPRTLLGTTPSTFISERVVGDVVTDGSSLHLPGVAKADLPKALELNQNATGGIVSIWGTNGTAFEQVQLKGTAEGGQLGIWGTSGTATPGAELVLDNGSGMLNLFPGSEWINGPDTAISMSVDSAGGLVSLWGQGGSGNPLGVFGADADGGRVSIWGTDGTSVPQVEMKGTDSGGQFGLWGTNTGASIWSGVSTEMNLWGSGTGAAIWSGSDAGANIWGAAGGCGIWGGDSGTVNVWGSAGGSGIWSGSGLGMGIWGAGGLGGGIWSPAQGGVGMGIWSSGSDTLFRVSEDGRGDVNLGIWGTNGTSIPQVEMKATATGGRFALGAAGGQLMPQLEATSGDNSGSLGIWGTNGTAMPVINMEATDTAGAIGLYFGVRAGDYPQVDIQGSPSRGSLKMWGDLHTRSNQPGVEFTSDSAGGLLFVRGSDDNARMMVYGEGYGDNAVFMSDNAVSSREILDEPGIAQSKGVSCNDVTSTSTMEDIQTISITIPSDGYIFLLGHAEAEFNGTTSGNRVDVQLDETSGGSPVNGNFVRIGLTAYSGTSYMDFDVSLQRTYFKSAGTYTFRMEARHLGSGDASLCFPIITAMYFPSSYGTVTTVAGNPEDNPDYRTVSSSGLGGDGTSETVYEVDLRHLELRAREARERALEAELDLQRARSAQDGMN